MLKKVLKQLKEGANNKNTINKNLNISNRLIEAIFDTALRKNYIKKVSFNGQCENCPFNTTCSIDSEECSTIETYKLTNKGKKLLKES